MSESTTPAPGSEGQQEGGDGTQNTPPAPSQQQQQQPQSDSAPASETQQANAEQSQQQEQSLEDASQEELLAEVKRLRRENARRRTDNTAAVQQAQEQAQQDLVARLAGALGITQEGEDNAPTVDDLTAELEQSQQTQRQQAVEFAAWQQAGELGVDPKALINQVSFQQATKDLDPSSETFSDDLKAAIEAEKTASPYIVVTQQTPGRSSKPLNQHLGTDGQGSGSKSPAELAAAVNKNNPY